MNGRLVGGDAKIEKEYPAKGKKYIRIPRDRKFGLIIIYILLDHHLLFMLMFCECEHEIRSDDNHETS
jgi:hypothetical protein